MNNHLSFISISPLYSYTFDYKNRSKTLYKISKRFYPKIGGEIGHATKLLNASKKIPPLPVSPGAKQSTTPSATLHQNGGEKQPMTKPTNSDTSLLPNPNKEIAKTAQQADKVLTEAKKHQDPLQSKNNLPSNEAPLAIIVSTNTKSSDAFSVEDISQNVKYYNSPSTSAVKAKLPIYFYDPVKLESQLNTNYIWKKYLPTYEKYGIAVPFIKEKYPSHGISGSYTLALDEKEKLIARDTDVIAQHGYIISRYAETIYGGKPIKNLQDALHRFDQLFTYDVDAYKYQKDSLHIHGIKGLFPKLQHMAALDTYSLLIPVKDVSYGPNINITTKTITMQTHSELCCLKKTHKFLIMQNRDEILVIDDKNPQHLLLLKTNAHIIENVAKQPVPDFLGNRIIGINQKVVYPIDIKRIGEPEIKLPMLSSYSSESPEYFGVLAANKMHGQLVTQIGKSNNEFLKIQAAFLKDILSANKKGKYSQALFEEEFNKFSIQFFQGGINSGNILFEGKSYLPSIIAATTLPQDNPYTEMQKTNPEMLNIMRKDAEKHFNFTKTYPTMTEYKTLSLYENNLEFMIFLKQYGMLENYYNLRKVFLIEELING